MAPSDPVVVALGWIGSAAAFFLFLSPIKTFSQIIKTGDRWTKKSQKSLLSKLTSSALGSTEQKSEKDKAFDLLDALSRSGALPIECAELHGAGTPLARRPG